MLDEVLHDTSHSGDIALVRVEVRRQLSEIVRRKMCLEIVDILVGRNEPDAIVRAGLITSNKGCFRGRRDELRKKLIRRSWLMVVQKRERARS